MHQGRRAIPHGHRTHAYGSPPPTLGAATSRSEQMPRTNRLRLVGLLSRLLERQLGHPLTVREEDGDDIDRTL